MVQWLRISLWMQRTLGFDPWAENYIPLAAELLGLRPKLESLHMPKREDHPHKDTEQPN